MPESVKLHDYDFLWRKILAHQPKDHAVTYLGGFIDWDNTPRYEERARVVLGANPDRFEFWFKQLLQKVTDKPEQEQRIFLNAWNEWAEGTYLEPDKRYGYQYLEVIQRCLQQQNQF